MSNRAVLLIFVKNPVLGKVKTRLASTLGAQKALEIYRLLLQHTADITRTLPADKVVFYSDFVEAEDIWDNALYQKRRQEGSDLGERMERAFAWAFRQGYSQVVIIGSDCPEISAGIIDLAFTVLREQAAVIGPARDGGYYLLGMNRLISQVFHNKFWSTPRVLPDTIADLRALHVPFRMLATLSDVDEAEDVKRFLPVLQKKLSL
jgi:uncharacterized protein